MVDEALRTPKAMLLRPLAMRLEAAPASTVTLAAVIVGLGAAATAAWGHHLWALVLWLLNRLLDGLDGEIARLHGGQSDWGGYLDLLADFLIYALLPIGLALSVPSTGVWIALALMLAGFYVNAASWMLLTVFLDKRRGNASAGGERTSLAMPTGLIEGAETVVLFALMLIFPDQLVPLLGVTAVLVAVTALQRLVWAARVLPRSIQTPARTGQAKLPSRAERASATPTLD